MFFPDKIFITGDIHGEKGLVARLDKLRTEYGPDIYHTCSLVILGDAGFNFYLNKSDYKMKSIALQIAPIIYCVRGNHEARPESIEGMELIYDARVQNKVWIEPGFGNVRYLQDGEIYYFHEHPTLVIGGAYSVDKHYRLEKYHGKGWFEDEQLNWKEMADITKQYMGKRFDFVFSHTCPRSWQPTDLFLPQVDSSTIDHSMEDWLEEFKDYIRYGIWCFGHYHQDRAISLKQNIFFEDLGDLDQMWSFYKKYYKEGEI